MLKKQWKPRLTNTDEYSQIVSYSKDLSANYLHGRKQPGIKGGAKNLDRNLKNLLLHTHEPDKVKQAVKTLTSTIRETYRV